MKTIDIIGEAFGKLLVIDRAIKNNKEGRARWIVWCSCGSEPFETVGKYLRNGDTQSCGCLNKQQTIRRSYKHGNSSRAGWSPEYTSWVNMIQRCENENNPSYQRWYGSRGIKVCNEWKNSFKQFLNDMRQKPDPNYSIDRIDNEKAYEPGNCRWATSKEQANNRRPRRKSS